MPIIPRYQARGGPSVGGLNYAGAFSPPDGSDWRSLARAAEAAGSIMGAVGTIKAPPKGERQALPPPRAGATNGPASISDLVEAKMRDLIWRRSQLDQPEANIQQVARSREEAGQGLAPAARAIFDSLTGLREAGFAAAAAGRLAADHQATAYQLSEERQALGIDEYVQLADVAPEQAMAALGSAISEATERLRAMGSGAEAIDAGRRGLLDEAVARRIRAVLASDPERASDLMASEGAIIGQAAQDRLRVEIDAEQARAEARRHLQRLVADHPGVEEDLEGLLRGAQALSGEAPERVAAYRGAAIAAWRRARAERETREEAAWGRAQPYLDSGSVSPDWTDVPGEVWTALSARQQAALRGHFEAPWRDSEPGAVEAALAMARASTQSFADLDLTSLLDRVNPADFNRLRELQKVARAGGPDWEQARRALPRAEDDTPLLVRAGWRDLPIVGGLFGQKTPGPDEQILKDARAVLDKEADQAFKKIIRRRFPDASQPQIQWEHIRGEENGWQWEGGPAKPPVTKGYVPTDKTGKRIENSSVTIASGVDIGKKSVAEVQAWGLDPALYAKLKPFINAQGRGPALLAEADRRKTPLVITPEEAEQLDRAAHGQELRQLIKRFDADSTIGPFVSLPARTQTVILSVYMQYGTSNPTAKAKKFWGMVTTGDWGAAHSELMNFGDKYGKRRKREAALLQQDLNEGVLKITPKAAGKTIAPKTPRAKPKGA